MTFWKTTMAIFALGTMATNPIAIDAAFAKAGKKTDTVKADPPPPIEHGKGQMLDKGPRWPHKQFAAKPQASGDQSCGKSQSAPCDANAAGKGDKPVAAKPAKDQPVTAAVGDPCNRPGVQCDPRDSQPE